MQGLLTKPATKLVLLTQGAQSAQSSVGRGLLGAAVWGFARSVRLELPHVQVKTIDASSEHLEAELKGLDFAADEAAFAAEAEIAYVEGQRCTPRLRQSAVPASSKRLAAGSHLISCSQLLEGF